MSEPVTFYVSTITSIIALALSSVTLGWTVYKDAIRKPKFRMNIAVKKIIQAGREADGPHIFLEALNLGPLPNRIGLPFARKNWLKRRFLDSKNGMAFIYPDYSHWATTRGASRIEVGDSATFVFPLAAGCFLKDDFAQIGMSDGFGTIHWAPKKELREAQERFQKAFPESSTCPLKSAQ